MLPKGSTPITPEVGAPGVRTACRPPSSSSSFAGAFTVGCASRSVCGPRHDPFLHYRPEVQQVMVVQPSNIGMTYITNSNYLLVYE